MASVVIVVAVGLFALPPEGLEPVVGPATVIDGDTIAIEGQPIDLWGIDAPEDSQTCTDPIGAEWLCGLYATQLLKSLVDAATVTCEPQGLTQERVLVAICAVDRRDLGWAMVAFGFALDVPEISGGAYGAPQGQSAAVHAGMWSGTFTNPRDWRADHRNR